MMKRFSLLVGLFFLFGIFNGRCQQDLTEKISSFHFGVTIMANVRYLIEERYSSLPFSGTAPAFSLFGKLTTKRLENYLDVFYSKGNLSPSVSKSLVWSETSLTANFHALFRVPFVGVDRFECKIGPSVQFVYQNRSHDQLINAGNSYETILSAGLVASLKYNLGKKSNAFYIGDRFTLPLLFYYFQPSYSGGIHTDNNFASFGQIKRYMNSLLVGKRISKADQFALVYTWDYFKMNMNRMVTQNSQQFGIQYQHSL